MTLAAGTKLGPYEILSPLGEGGMGEVYRAKDTRLGREVALKVLSARLTTNTGARERFERESKAVAALSHPNILALYDVGLEGGDRATPSRSSSRVRRSGKCSSREASRSGGRSTSRPRSGKDSWPRTRRGSSTGISSPKTSS